MIDFRKKITTQRPQPSENAGVDSQLAFESDRGRIINSAAVRRLQQKTQVFPLERNAAVRSRLTHSLEVQQTGRFISQQIYRELKQRQLDYGLLDIERAFESLVEMACLMHDMGNPPFGHFGEAAISEWFASVLPNLPQFSAEASAEAQALAFELTQFEGNAQAIRLIANLQRLNLTYAQTACVLKYTRPATAPKPEPEAPLNYLMKKPGYYRSEALFIAALQEALDITPGHRYPLTYVMEAADDISYCLADLEDGVDKGLLSVARLVELLNEEFKRQCAQDWQGKYFNDQSFHEILSGALEKSAQEPINKAHEFFIALRVSLIYPLVQHAAQRFVDHIESIYHGHLNQALLEDGSPAHAVINTLKAVAVRHVFATAEVETLELQGYHLLTGILEHYSPLLQLSGAQFLGLTQGKQRGLLRESRLFNRLPRKHVKAYLELLKQPHKEPELWEIYCRCRLLQDMVSGMTDQFALDEYRTLTAGSAQ
ncbi:MAG: dGTPase [Idiomarinaceae bacterium HL-53]|nr:MAG: dGTPase [Idiomarinaceae bacterium HL-53]CUS48099.1 dGTPase [Idiomarinaceae bacterium HL-53]